LTSPELDLPSCLLSFSPPSLSSVFFLAGSFSDHRFFASVSLMHTTGPHLFLGSKVASTSPFARASDYGHNCSAIPVNFPPPPLFPFRPTQISTFLSPLLLLPAVDFFSKYFKLFSVARPFLEVHLPPRSFQPMADPALLPLFNF